MFLSFCICLLYYLARNLVAFCSVGVGWMEIVLTIALSVTVAIIADLIKHRGNQPTYHVMIMMMATMRINAIMIIITFTVTLTKTNNIVIVKIIILIIIITRPKPAYGR